MEKFYKMDFSILVHNNHSLHDCFIKIIIRLKYIFKGCVLRSIYLNITSFCRHNKFLVLLWIQNLFVYLRTKLHNCYLPHIIFSVKNHIIIKKRINWKWDGVFCSRKYYNDKFNQGNSNSFHTSICKLFLAPWCLLTNYK